MRTSTALGCALVLWGLCGSPSSSEGEPWEFLVQVPGARYTYDLTTTANAVYAVLGDSLENTMGLYRYDRLAPGVQMEFVGKPGEPLYGVYVGGENDEHIWLGSRGFPSSHEDYLWYSSDGGATWVVKGSAAYGEYFALTGSRDGSQVYVASHSVLCFQSSSDYGETWRWWGGCSNNLFGARAMETDSFDSGRAYASIMSWLDGSTFFVETTNGGQDWEEETLDFSAPAFGGVYPSPFREGDLGLAIDGGRTYTRIDGVWNTLPDVNLGPVYGIAQPVWDGGAWWIVGLSLDDTIRVGRNDGGGWVGWEEGLPRVVVDPSVPRHNRARLWACPTNGDVFLMLANGGLWFYQGPTTSAPEISLVPGPWGQVHPNPSDGQVTLTLGNLPGAPYRIVVFDVFGRKVRTLHDGSLEGSSTWRWDGRDAVGRPLPTGVYLFRVVVAGGRGQLSEKVLLLRR